MGLLLLAGFALGRFWSLQGQLTFCAFGVATGAAFARMCHPMNKELTLLGWTSLVFLAASQVFYQILVWSEAWRVDSSVLGWRLWWGTIVVTVCLGLLQVLWRAGARWEWNSGRTTLCFTTLLGLLLAGLAFRPNLMASTPAWWEMLALLSALGTVLGSGVIIIRWIRKRPKNPRPLPRGMKTALRVTAQLVLVVGAFYIGRITMPQPSPFDLLPSALASMSPEQLERQIASDHRALRDLAGGLDDLRSRADTLHASIMVATAAEGREIYSPEENRKIRGLFLEYLSHRDRLIRMAAMYSGFKGVGDKRLRDRSFLAGYCAAATVLESGRLFVAKYRDDARARAKLNEAEPGWLKEGMFDQVYQSVTSTTHMDLFAEYGKYLAIHRERWRREELFPTEDFDWLTSQIDRCTTNIYSVKLSHTRAWFSRISRRMQREISRPMYEAQELVAALVGDTRIVRRPWFISVDQVQQAVKDLQPGDIILERRNWFLSNAFLPGFWPHTALYVGTPEQLAKLGINKTNAGAGWADYVKPDHGHPRVVMEAVSDGVIFASAEHSMHADYVAVLRPILTDEEKKQALLVAFKHHGRDYDFNFDFGATDKLVCSELVYHAYNGLLKFKLEKVLGKDVLTPLGIMRKFVNERHSGKKAQLEFVVFLDTAAGQDHAHFANVEACCESVDRPKAFNE